MADAKDEKDMYFHTNRLLDFLATWRCPQELTFFQCVYKLTADMATSDFWAEDDVEIARLWLEDLVSAGYEEPSRVSVSSLLAKLPVQQRQLVDTVSRAIKHTNSKAKEEDAPSELDQKWAVSTLRGSFVYFTAVEQPSPSIISKPSTVSPNVGVAAHVAQIAALCPAIPAFTTRTDVLNAQQPSHFSDILIIVTYNWPHYTNVKFMEILHRQLFPNMVYCGSNAESFHAETKNLNLQVTFIEAPVNYGMQGYHCMVRAMEMSYNVKGYLTVADDALINTWKFQDMDKDKVWYTQLVYPFNMTAGTPWMWWNHTGGKVEMAQALNTLKLFAFNPPTHDFPDTNVFFSNLKAKLGSVDFAVNALSDVYYVPRRLAKLVLSYLRHFVNNGVMLELAVPMTLFGIGEEFQIYKDTNLWMEERLNPWIRYSPDDYFLHPVKLSNLTNIAPMCNIHLTQLLLRSYGPIRK